MPKVALLPDVLASQVAAGEVVERPASVVKELVENSLDAGATKIEIVIRRGGIALIRITDNGCGMGKEDALMSLERHATSKLRTKEDLGAIGTLGFRGEALPSIASVSKFTLSTREKGAVSGTEVRVDGGRVESVGDSGEAPGTRIEVRSLFFNVPARRKFLRTEVTEFGHIEHQVRLQAIAHPGVAFTLIHNDRVCFQLAAGTRLDRIRGIAGGEVSEKLLEAEFDDGDGVRVSGFVGDPRMLRSQRSSQLFFLNDRPVENQQLSYGVSEGYRGHVAGSGYPVVFLFLEVPLEEVDVNVHPAKREVRFRRGNQVRDAITESIRAAMVPREKNLAPPSAPKINADRGVVRAEIPPKETSVAPADPFQADLEYSGGNVRAEDEADESEVAPVDSTEGEQFDFLSSLERGYLLLRSGEGLVLMDQRAAHERVLYEQFIKGVRERSVPEQGLLVPYTLELGPKDFALVYGNLEMLVGAGVRAEVFGSNTIKIDAMPACMSNANAAVLVDAMIDEMRSSARAGGSRIAEEEFARILAGLGAIKRTASLKEAEIEALVGDLMACEMPYCSPSGKPTLVQISYPEIDRKFGKGSGQR